MGALVRAEVPTFRVTLTHHLYTYDFGLGLGCLNKAAVYPSIL